MIGLRTLMLGLFTVASANALAAGCGGFADVDSSATYCTAVTYVQQRGVTIGCTDSVHYCPNDYVTRAQMALFLQRMGQADPSNTLGDHTSAIGGGVNNSATGDYSVIAGGVNNLATGNFSVVSGGVSNTATETGGTILGGIYNVASGGYSLVLGGSSNTASAGLAIAMGFKANADEIECLVINLWVNPSEMNCGSAADVVRVGADRGMSIDYHSQVASGFGSRFVAIGDLNFGQTITTWTGAYLSDAGVWTNVSDRYVKEDFTAIDNSAILERVVRMPVQRWRYKSEPEATHIGPVAQDFYAAFDVGSDDKHITTIDEGGVALAAIQGLNAKLEARNLDQNREIAARDARILELTARLERLEGSIAH